MANTGVRGRVVDDVGTGIADLVVAAYDVEVILDDTLLRNTATAGDPLFPGLVRTDAGGNFEITYPANAYGLESKPDIKVRVYDSMKRLLHETEVHNDVEDTTLVLPDIVIPRAHAEGWLVTLGTDTPQRLSTGNSVRLMVDNEEAWAVLTDSVMAATQDLRFLLLLWDTEDMITKFDPGQPVVGTPTTGAKLDDRVVTASEAPRNVRAGIVMWDVWLWPDFLPPDFTSEAKPFFKKPPSAVAFRSFATHLFVPMHAKSVIVRGAGIEGFLIGSPFLQEYYDGSRHEIDDMRRGEFGPLKSQMKIPIHDVSSRIVGPAVADIDATFRLHWDKLNDSGDLPLPAIPAPAAQPDNISIQIVRSLPGREFTGMDRGETGIFEAYLRAFKNAEDYIYLENQYFTCSEIGDALVLAIKQKPDLQLIVLTNNKVDVPLYGPIMTATLFEGWQVRLIERILKGVTDTERERIGFFTLWSHEAAAPKPRIIRNYVHSKVGIVDDKWATAGSANLDGVGLNTSQHFLAADTLLFGLLPDAYVAVRRSSEMNAVIYNNIAGQPANDVVSGLRKRLWAEHLGFVDGAGNPDPTNAAVNTRPAEGWLELWKSRADARVASLRNNPAVVHPARILPYPHNTGDIPRRVDKPVRYLRALEIDPKQFKIEESVKEFRFKTGRWI